MNEIKSTCFIRPKAGKNEKPLFCHGKVDVNEIKSIYFIRPKTGKMKNPCFVMVV